MVSNLSLEAFDFLKTGAFARIYVVDDIALLDMKTDERTVKSNAK
jgi:hypothetical protein